MPCCFQGRIIVLLFSNVVSARKGLAKSCQWITVSKASHGCYEGNSDPSCPSALALSEPGDLPLTVSSGLCHPPRQLSVSFGDVKKQNTTLEVNQLWKIETGFIFPGFDVLSSSCKNLPLFCFD